MTDETIFSLEEARAAVRRGIDKTEELIQRTSFVAVDRFGVVITASRMDGARVLSYRTSRAKAHLAAVQQFNPGELYDFAMAVPKILIEQMGDIVREPIFHGQGAQIVLKKGEFVGALSTGVGIAPAVQFPGVDPSKLIADGKAANGEDLVTSYALGNRYNPQHGDDEAKWVKTYGKPPEGRGTAMDEAPPASKQVELDAAIRLSDAAMAEAERRKVFVSVAIVDMGGEVVQLDRMDGASPMTPDAAVALAATAMNFRGTSTTASTYPDLEGLAAATKIQFHAAPGGLAVFRDGCLYGGIGVHGADPQICAEIAQAAIGGD
jgi:uncharacterized protein GlcG (DUF336 family)